VEKVAKAVRDPASRRLRRLHRPAPARRAKSRAVATLPRGRDAWRCFRGVARREAEKAAKAVRPAGDLLPLRAVERTETARRRQAAHGHELTEFKKPEKCLSVSLSRSVAVEIVGLDAAALFCPARTTDERACA